MTSQASSGPGPSQRGATFATRVFTVAGVYGVLVLAPQYFMEGRIGRDFPPPITHPEHFYGFIGVALAWQVLFLIVARDPIRYRLAIIPAVLEKLAFGGATLVLYLQGRLSPVTLGGASSTSSWRSCSFCPSGRPPRRISRARCGERRRSTPSAGPTCWP